MNPEIFFALAFGLVGVALFGKVMSGRDPFPSETRGKRRFNSIVFAFLLSLFLAQIILQYPKIPRWVLIASVVGLILGIGASLSALRIPTRATTPEHEA